MLPSLTGMSGQDKAAQTRIENDQSRAKNSQMASQSLGQMRNQQISTKPANGPRYNPAPVGSALPATQGGSAPSTPRTTQPGPGPQPTGKFGEFIKKMAAQQQMQQQAGPQGSSPASRDLDIETLMQSPALQEAVTRTKLQAYFSKQGGGDNRDYGDLVVANMNRYQ